MTAFDRLKLLCDKQGISVNELEDRIGVGKNSLYSWKKNIPKGSNLLKVADYFDVTTDFLLSRTNEPNDYYYSDSTMNTVDKIMRNDNPVFMELVEKLSKLSDKELKVLDSMADSLISLK